jgi:uncharacterized repeat protein (TIGR01451 family)
MRARYPRRGPLVVGAAALGAAVLLLGATASPAGARPTDPERARTVPAVEPAPGRGATRSAPVVAGTSKPVRELARAVNDPKSEHPEGTRAAPPKKPASAERSRPSVQTKAGVDALDELTAPLVQFAGQTGGTPPDTVGDVGPNHYVQMVNTTFQIFTKQGVSLAGPTAINSLWTSNGVNDQQCDLQNAGDPIVLYDQAADRFMLSQFTNPGTTPFFMCIAYARTADPTGAYHTYAFQLPRSHDYMKYGIWPDGLYMSTFEGSTLGAYVFDRATMLNGGAATFQDFGSIDAGDQFRGQRILPSDWDGQVTPPAGAPNYFVQSIDGAFDSTTDRLEVFEARVDWGNPANSSFTNVTDLPTVPFSIDTNCADDDGNGVPRNCVPQPGTTNRVDALTNRLLHRLQYRNFGTYESMVTNQTIDDGADRHVVRWYELRKQGAGAWTIHQQGTYGPGTAHRWMGSAAMDRAGNIALGYSISDPVNNVFPSVAYTGRRADAPLGLLPEPEFTMFAGTNAQTDADRWGDYSAMTVDPLDDCTFWYTQMHGGNRQTRIGSFRFNSCVATDLRVSVTDSPDPVVAGGQLQYTVQVTNAGPRDATNVVVTDDLPAGVTFLASSPACTGTDPLTCDLGTVPAGTSKPLTIQVRVPPNLLSSAGVSTAILTNTVSVAADQPDPNPSNNTATATTTVIESADLAVRKLCKPDGSAGAGDTAFCEIYVDNLGPSDAQNVTLTDTLTSSTPFTVTSVAVTPGGTCTPATPIGPTTGATLTCDLGTEPAAGRTTVRVEVVATDAGDINDVATVAASTPDPVTANNSAAGRVTYTGLADLGVTKTAAPDPAIAGENLTYTLTVRNNGPSTARGVVLTDTLPAGTTVVSVTPPAGANCLPGTPGNPLQPISCALGNVGPGATRVVVVVVRVASNVADGTLLVNNATVSSETADPNNANNLVSTSVTVRTRADLAVTKTSDKEKYTILSPLVWTVTVRNNGPSDAQAAVVTDQLPPHKQAAYISNTGGCGKVGDVLTCNLGTVAAGATVTFTVREKTGVWTGKVRNTATVTAATPDPVAANNTATKEVQVKYY